MPPLSLLAKSFFPLLMFDKECSERGKSLHNSAAGALIGAVLSKMADDIFIPD
jgi:hypothetical protein